MTAGNPGRRVALCLLPVLALLVVIVLSADGAFAALPQVKVQGSKFKVQSSQLKPQNSKLKVIVAQPAITYRCVQAGNGATGAPCANPTAYPDIQTAVAASVASDEIRVASGTYTGSGAAVVTVGTALTIKGGFTGGTSGWGTSNDSVSTLIDGQGLRIGVQITGGANVTIDNLTVGNGGITNGGTVSVEGSFTLNISNGGTTNGSFSVASLGAVAFPVGNQTLSPGTTFSGAGYAKVTGGTVTIGGAVNAQNFELSAGTITGTSGGSSLTVSGNLNWNGGVMDGLGTTNVGASGTMHIGGISSTKILQQRALNNNGHAYMDGTGNGVFYMGSSAVFNNNAGAYFDIANNDSVYYYNGTAPSIHNFPGAFIRKTGGSLISTVGNGFITLNNDGEIDVQSGTLSLDGASTDSGTFTANVGARLRFNGNTHTLGSSSQVTIAGTIEFSAGTVYIQGGYNVTGVTLMTGGTVVFGGPATIANLQVDPNTTFTVDGSLSVSNIFQWNGGIVNGNGTLTMLPGSTMHIGGVQTAKYLLRCHLVNNGTALVDTTGLGALYLGDGAVLDNNGTFDIRNNDSIYYFNGVAPTINNNSGATFQKSLGTGVSVVSNSFLSFNNDGTVNVITGTMSFDGGASSTEIHTHNFVVSQLATLRFNGGAHSLSPSSSVTGAGNVEFMAGTTNIAGTYAIGGSTNVTGGTVVFNSDATSNNGLITAGTFDGSAVFTFTGTLNWNGGTMTDSGSGAGLTTIAPVGVMNLGGVTAQKLLTRRTLNNLGLVRMNGTGIGYLYIGNGATFNNGLTPGSTATFDFQNNDSVIYLSGNQSIFNNNGTVRKSGGGAISTIGSGNLAFNNYNAVDVVTGTLSMDGGNTGLGSSGTFTVGLSSNLRFNGGNHTLRPGSSILGAGSVEFSLGVVSIAGNYNIGGATRVTGGTVNFNTNAISGSALVSSGFLGGSAPFNFTVNGTFDWTGGTMNDTGTTTVAATGVLNIGGVGTQKLLSQRTLINNGTARMNGTATGVLYIGNGAGFYNGTSPGSSALFDIQNNDSILYFAGPSSVFSNTGTLTKSGGAATTTLGSGNLAFNNGGAVNILTGTLSLDGGNSTNLGSSGAFTVTSVANLRFNGGNTSLQPPSRVVGAGNVEFSSGIVNIAGAYNITGGTSVTGGTVNFNSPLGATSTSSALSAGTLAGAGVFTTTGAFDWTGGTMNGDAASNSTTVIASSGVFNIRGVNATRFLLQRTLNNNGTTRVNGTGTGIIYMGSGATFNNNGTFDLRNNDSLLYLSGANSFFNNNSTFVRSIGAGVSTFGNGNLSFNNNGSVNVMTGTLSLDGGGNSSGSFTMSSVADLRFNGGTHTLQPGSIFTGSGNVDFSLGVVNIAGSYNVVGNTNITGGTVNFNSPNGATADTALLSAGTLAGTGAFTVTNSLSWTGGSMDSVGSPTGSTNTAPGATLYMGGVGTNKILVSRTFNNRGTVIMNGTGAGVFYMGSGAVFNNASAATFNIQNNDSILYFSGADPTFNNDGTFRKTAGTGINLIGSGTLQFLNNSGTVQVDSGVINFGAVFRQTGGTTRLNGGNISTPGQLDIRDGNLTGSGIITGTVLNAGTVRPGDAPGLPAGILVVNGTYTQRAAGALNVDIGGLNPGIDFDQLNVTGNATLSGTVNISITNNFSPNLGNLFPVMGYGTRTGTFGAINGSNIGGGRYFTSTYGTANFILGVSGVAPTNTPSPQATGTPATSTPTTVTSPTVTPTRGSATVTVTPCAMNFSDVHSTDYFYVPVRYLYCAGVISGYADGTFRPFSNTTRGQLSKIVVLAMGWTLYCPQNPTFVDVPIGSTFFCQIETAYLHNIISGYSCGSGCLEFRPGANVTRAQLCKIVVLAKGWTIYTPPTPTFIDVPTTHTFYQYIETAYSKGIISGYSCGTGCLEFRPNNYATRGQICKIVYTAVTQP